MSDGMKTWFVGLGVVVGVLALTWVIQGNDFFLYRTFAPKYEATRRETFEQSKAYRQGMVQELQNMQFEYVKASSDSKAALASIILHRAADVDETTLPADLRQFLRQLKAEKGRAR
jgi:hypothetical protein